MQQPAPRTSFLVYCSGKKVRKWSTRRTYKRNYYGEHGFQARRHTHIWQTPKSDLSHLTRSRYGVAVNYDVATPKKHAEGKIGVNNSLLLLLPASPCVELCGAVMCGMVQEKGDRPKYHHTHEYIERRARTRGERRKPQSKQILRESSQRAGKEIARDLQGRLLRARLDKRTLIREG